ncbi:MAG: class I SAM-dependent methyltransferase [Mycobacteriales bacterium]
MTASREKVQAAYADPKLANVLYHDWVSTTYDEKWSIDFDDRCTRYARDRFVAIAGAAGWPYQRTLEIGCGTGFFSLNLWRAGVVREIAVTDISPGMVDAAVANARRLGVPAQGRVGDAESLPFEDASFDLVVGHAVLHHIPDVRRALAEVLRVLRPGGRFVFAGEPTRWGDAIARRLCRLTWGAATRVTRLPGLSGWRRPGAELAESARAAALEAVVDLHTFAPDALRRIAVCAGAVDVLVRTEELTAAWFGWPARTLEYAVPKDKLGGMWWAMFCYRSWLRLAAVDERLLARVVPEGLFYNALLPGGRPPSAA